MDMLNIIRKNINRRMDVYTDSRQPTGDEVAIAWLVSEIDRLQSKPKHRITDDAIRACMLENNNNKSQVARVLGVTYKTIQRRWKKLDDIDWDVHDDKSYALKA